MILAVDIGNSSVKIGLIGSSTIVKSHTFKELEGDDLKQFVSGYEIVSSGIASVVPERTPRILNLLSGISGNPPLIVGPDLKLPFDMGYLSPETLGADRLAAAVAGRTLFPDDRCIVIIDAGTAVTFDVISDGVFLGGSIGPGPDLIRKALARETAQLPEINPILPPSIIGRTTEECLQSGVMGGFLESAKGLLKRISAELSEKPRVLLTGGWASFLEGRLGITAVVEPHLVLYGIRDLLRINQQATNSQ